MLKRFYVTVTYDLYALDETDATGQVFTHRVEPETVDVLDLPTRQKIEFDIVPF